jgi:UDP-N-acetylglucosamine:LPS N-acetylglucosamine transferase
LNARFLEAKGGGVVCEDKRIEDDLLEEVREMMFNEELRVMIRQNLYALDRGDIASIMETDIRNVLSSETGRETKRMRFWKAFA